MPATPTPKPSDPRRSPRLTAALLNLSPVSDTERQVIALRCRDGLSYADLAARLGMTIPEARDVFQGLVARVRLFNPALRRKRNRKPSPASLRWRDKHMKGRKR